MNRNLKTCDAVRYHGNVHIKYRYNKKNHNIRIHNAGLGPLFTSIALALGERTVEAKTYMPKYIVGKTEQDQDCFYTKIIVQNRTYYKGTALNSGEDCNTIRYTFSIPSTNMIPHKIIKKLELQNELGSACAKIELENTNEISTDIGATVLIYWDLTFIDGDEI